MQHTAEDLASEESFQEYALGLNREATEHWERWIEQNPEKQGEIELARMLVRNLQFRSPVLDDKKDFDRQQLQYRLFHEEHKVNFRERSIRPHFRFWKVAAAIVLLAAAGCVLWMGKKNNWFYQGQTVAESNPLTEKVTQKGQKRTVRLTDGTVVKLNSESTLRVEEDFDQQTREVYLQGEAFFDVAHDPMHPFIVHTGAVETRVLGTKFNLRAYPNENSVEVALVEGKVKVLDNDAPEVPSAMLKPHQMIRIDESTRHYDILEFNELEVSGWKDGVIYFKNAGIAEIIKKLDRWYNVEIQVKGHLGKKAFSGEFDGQSLDKVLNGIGFSLHFQYSIEGKKVVIQPKV